eukprot:UC4_evm4s594
MHIYISVAIAAIVLVAMVVCSMRLRRQKINNPNFGFQLGWNRHYARARGQSMGTYESPTPTAQHHIPNFDTSDANSRKSNSSDYVLSDSDDANYDDEPLDTNSDAGYDFLNLEGAHFGYPPTRSLSETNRHYMAPESVEQQLLHALRAYIGAHTNHTANSNDDELKSSSLEEHVSSEHLSKLIERISGESSQSESIVESLETFKENLNDYSDPVCSHETSKDMHEIAFDPSADFHVDISTNDMPTLQPLSEEIGNFIKKLDDVTAKDVSKMTYDEVRESLSKLDRVAFRDLVTIHKNLISRLVILAFGEFPNGKLTLRLIRVLICDLVGLSPEEVSQADRSILRSIVASVMNDIKFANSSSQLKKMSKGASQLHIDLQIAELNQQIEMIDKVAQVENELREVEDLLEKGSPSPSSSPISSDLPKNSENNGYLMVQGFDDEIKLCTAQEHNVPLREKN